MSNKICLKIFSAKTLGGKDLSTSVTELEPSSTLLFAVMRPVHKPYTDKQLKQGRRAFFSYRAQCDVIAF